MRDVTDQKRPELIHKPKSRLDRVGAAIDSAVFALAPAWRQKRIAARTKQRLIDRQVQRLVHPSMHPSVSRDHRFIGSRQSTDEQLLEDLQAMQYRSREMVVTNPHASGAVEGRVAHEIGVRLACRPEIQPSESIGEEVAELANEKLKEVCRQWSEHGVDRQRQFSLAAVQRIMQRTYASYGECFLVLREAPFFGPIGLTVELINPMQCETPPKFASDENVKLGIRYHSRSGQILGYYFRKVDRLHRNKWNAEYEFIRRYDSQGMQRCCHIFEPILPDQSRGIPWLMAAIPFLKDIDDFHEAELINKQVEACLRASSSAMNYPYEVLAKNFFRTTYSSGRLAMLDGKLGFDMRLQPTVDMGMRPIWRRLVSDAFFHGEMEGIATLVSYLADRKPWWRHSWGGDAFGSVDPEKELKAHQIGLETGQETLAMIAAERNADWKDLLTQRDLELREEIKLRVAREKMEMVLREAAGLAMVGEEVESSEGKESKLGCVSVDEIRNAID